LMTFASVTRPSGPMRTSTVTLASMPWLRRTGGRVTDAKVIKPSPHAEFNAAALAAAWRQTWEPARKDGVPMSFSQSYTYNFRLEESSSP
jgi:TonB family protein